MGVVTVVLHPRNRLEGNKNPFLRQAKRQSRTSWPILSSPTRGRTDSLSPSTLSQSGVPKQILHPSVQCDPIPPSGSLSKFVWTSEPVIVFIERRPFIQRYSGTGVRNGVPVRFMRDKATKYRGTLTSDQQDDARSLGSIPTDSSEVWLSSDPKLLTHRWDRQTDRQTAIWTWRKGV